MQLGDLGYDANISHGLIAAPSDQSVGIQWYNGQYTITGAVGSIIGTGNSNTITIIANQGSGNYAAKLCSDFAVNGFSDWYLPSRAELAMLYQNRIAIGGFDGSISYWSSTEYNSNNAWYKYFGRFRVIQ